MVGFVFFKFWYFYCEIIYEKYWEFKGIYKLELFMMLLKCKFKWMSVGFNKIVLYVWEE